MKWFLLLLLPLFLGAECQSIKATGSHDWVPVSYLDEGTKEAKGVGPELLKAVSEQLNVPIEMDLDLPWKRAMLRLELGGVDIFMGAYETRERRENFHLSYPFYTDEIRVFVMQENAFPFSKLSDLIGKKGGRPFGGSYGQTYDDFDRQYLHNRQEYSTDTLWLSLKAGDLDYVVFGYFDGLSSLGPLGLKEGVRALDAPVASNPVHFLFSKKSSCAHLFPKIDSLIKDLVMTGEAGRVLLKYLPKH